MEVQYVGVRIVTNVLFAVRCPFCHTNISIRKLRRITKRATEVEYIANGCEHYLGFYPSIRTAMFAI